MNRLHDAVVVELLKAIRADDNTDAKAQLFSYLYRDLKEVAAQLTVDYPQDHTLKSGALVHEVFLRTNQDSDLLKPEDRSALMGILVRVMKDILVEHERKKSAQKRGGGLHRMPLDDVADHAAMSSRLGLPDGEHAEFKLLDDLLAKLDAHDPQRHEVFLRRFFGDLSFERIAKDLGLTVDQTKYQWRIAKDWLRAKLRRRQGHG